MESEGAQEEDLTHIIQDVKAKESCDPTDENPLKSEYLSEKDNASEMLFDTSEYIPQVGKINGKVSEKEEEEDVNAEELSQSSSSDDSTGSSDVSSSSSDDEVNSSHQNQWSSSVTNTGIKLCVRGIRNSDDAASNRASFCEEVTSRLSDDSSSDEETPSEPVSSNCNNVSEKDSLDVKSPNSFNSISNFPSNPTFEDSVDKISFNSRNDRRSIDSVCSHLSAKSNDILERKLSLSSESSDSESELVSASKSINTSVESNLLNSVKSPLSNSNNTSFKSDLSDRFNELSDSTCVKFNSVNTTRSPEKKIASPIKENFQSNSLDRFSAEKESQSDRESIPNTTPENPSQVLSPKLSNNSENSDFSQISNSVDQSQNNLSNSLSKPENETGKTFNETNCVKSDVLSEADENASQIISDSETSRPVFTNENQVSSDKENDSRQYEHNNDLDLDFKSQDMGMEISSDSSLSSDEEGSHDLSDLSFESKSDKETEEPVDVMQVIGVMNEKNTQDVVEAVDASSEEEFDESMTSEKEMENPEIDVMSVIGVTSEKEANKPVVDVMDVIGVSSDKSEPQETIDNDTTAKETMVDVMNVIGISSDKSEPQETINNDATAKEAMADIMNVIGVPSEKETVDVGKVLKSPTKEVPMEVDVMKVIGTSDFDTSKPDQSFSILKSQLEGVGPFQKPDSIKQSSSSVSNSELTALKNKTSAEDIKDSNLASCSGERDSNSSSVREEKEKSDSELVNRIDELDPVKNEELEKAENSDNILSIISKDLKTNNGTKTLSKRKRLLLKQKKGAIKFKKKLKLLKNLSAGNSLAQVPDQDLEKGEEPIAEYAQYLGLQPTLKFKCCICAQIGFQSYPELREHQKNCQATEAGRSSAVNNSVSIPCTNAEDINQTNFRITRKVYLCSACGTYYENWNLFLHMQEVHQRYICLLCLGMFTMSYKLSDHLILTHGVEVKSFQNLLDFRQAFNCALYVSCTDCGRTFGESDNWSSHHCLFTCNVCNIKNGHLPRCPRNFFVKADETSADMKLPTKCIIRINPGACTTTTILPKRDDKSYDFASNFCSVDITEMGESSQDSEKTESPCLEKSTSEKSNPSPMAVSEKIESENSEVENPSPKESSLQAELINSKVKDEVGEKEETNLKESEEEKVGNENEKNLKIENENEKNVAQADENDSNEEISECNNTITSELSGNHGNQSNDDEIEKTSETSGLTSDSESGSEDEKREEMSSAEEKAEIINNPSDMKLIIKKSALNNCSFKISSKPNKTLSDEGIPENAPDEIKDLSNKSDSSVSHPENVETGPPRSRSITSPVNCDEKVAEPVVDSNSILRETLDFKNRLNSDSDIQNESQVTENEEREKDVEMSVESQGSVSDDSRMDYESDAANSKADDNVRPDEKVPSPNNTNNTWDSDSNRLSMAVENTDTKDASDEKMMIDYDGDNAVDNADNSTVGQSESNSSDEGSPAKNDGITLAAEDVAALPLPLSSLLDSMNLNTIVKECVRVSCTACAYCNHALKIAVNAKELVLHLLAEHKFTPAKDEDSPKKLVSVLKNGLTDLESVFFNTDSYDSSDKSANRSYDGTFSCFQCPFWTLQHKDLYTHKRKMHQKTILLCVMCKSNFYSYSELLCHMCPGTYQPNDILFRCCFCHMDKIPSAFRLMVHIRKIHHTCEICLDVSTDQQKLATHMWKHKLHHLCYRCGIAYRNKPDITRHLFWKHGTESVLCKKCLQKKWPHVYHFCIPPATVVCDECNATFTRTVALRVHKRLHTNEKPHACTQCEEKFISKKILAKHEISHSVKENQTTEEKKENYDPTLTKSLLGITDPPVQIQKTDEKQNIDVDDETVPVIRIKKNKTKKSKPMLDLTDLPPLNLSSDSDSEPEPPKEDKTAEPVVTTATEEVKSEIEDKPQVVVNSMPDISDSKELTTSPDTQEKIETEEKKENIVESVDSQRLEIILADHDYCKPQSDEKEIEKGKESNSENKVDSVDVRADLNGSPKATIDTKDASASDSSPTKRKSKSPKKKLNKSSNSSSSSSSSDTDSSSCSCGPNCSCSSSSSDSSTSTSSDSDSSNPENRRKQEERRQKRRERGKTKSPKTDPEPVISVENEEPYILESDLDTDITLTDEDFYDEYPQQHANKMLAEKQNSEKDQLMLLASVAPTHTAPSSPVVSAEEAVTPQPASSPKLKKKLKTKRKRDETLVPSLPSVQSFESKLSLPSATPPLITKLPNPNARNYMSMSQTPTSEHFSDRTMSTGGSGSESESKRSSKRRRTKNRFYGYSSEEENHGETSKPRFKPKKLKKVIAVRKSEPTLTITRPNPFNVTLPTQPAMPTQQQYKPYTPTISIKPVLPPVTNIVRSTLPPVRHRPPSPFSTSDSDDDKLNIDEAPQPQAPQPVATPQAMLTPTLAAALAAPQQSAKNSNLYCYCQCPYDEVSEMIACDGDNCMIEWFHFECVGIMVPPKGQWFCPDCRKKKNSY